jgi:serine/threonine protein kinase
MDEENRTGGGPGGDSADRPPRRSEPGQVVDDRYELRENLGEGGMGVVWEARDRRLGRTVAVKELRLREQMNDRTRALWVRRAQREANAIARISHEHVVNVYDVIEEGGQVWIVMEQVNPRSLAEVISSHGHLPAQDAARMGLEVLRGLRAVHRVGVLHRDVKPQNVLFRRDGRAVLMDFGISTFEGAAQVTGPFETVGTPAYLAPELADFKSAPSAASDLWSLGVTLFEMAEGRAPFGGPTPYEVLEAVRTEDLPPMEHAGPLGPVIRGLLAKDPAERMTAQQAEELLQHVAQETPVRSAYSSSEYSLPQVRLGPKTEHPAGADEAGAEEPPGESEPPPPPPPPDDPDDPPEPPARRWYLAPGMLPVAIVLCLALLAGLGWFTVQRLREHADPLSSSATIANAKGRDRLIVGVKDDQPGTSAKVSGVYRGFDIDLAKRIAADLGFRGKRVQFYPVRTISRETFLTSGQVDLIVASYSMTKERERTVDFAGPYFLAGQDFLVRTTDADLAGPEALNGRLACTVTNSTSLQRLRKDYPGIRVTVRTSYNTCVQDLLAGTVDAVTSDDVILAGYAHEYPGKVELLGQPFGREQYGVGIAEGDPALREAICRSVTDYVQDGGWAASYAKNLKRLIPLEPRTPRPCPED